MGMLASWTGDSEAACTFVVETPRERLTELSLFKLWWVHSTTTAAVAGRISGVYRVWTLKQGAVPRCFAERERESYHGGACACRRELCASSAQGKQAIQNGESSRTSYVEERSERPRARRSGFVIAGRALDGQRGIRKKTQDDMAL